jgi:hypothetical protein
MNSLFGPLGREYCVYFYFLSILFFVMFATYLLMTVVNIVRNPKMVNGKMLLNSVFLLIYTLVPYYVNRLMYTMCVNSVH